MPEIFSGNRRIFVRLRLVVPIKRMHEATIMARKQNVTFADIAKYTNFSKTTISRYFNNPDSLTEKNQKIIADALEKLNYQENKVARLISMPLSILFIVGGAVAIAIGGDVTVDAAARIAGDLGMSQTLIGLTIVSIGTSLPELVTSIVAAKKNEVDMALGNAVGSNIFNILMVLGIASAISPITLIRENIIDLCVLIVFTVCVWIFAATKKRIGKVEGFCMIALYVAYAIYIVIR